jgi:hypothetical protein
MARPFGLGPKTLTFIIVGLGHVVVTCDGAILKVNAPMFVDVFGNCNKGWWIASEKTDLFM